MVPGSRTAISGNQQKIAVRYWAMQEYISEAIVLNKEPAGDLDARISIFTKRFGKLVAKAKSARRIISKLSGHLEPGNLVDVRIVEKNGLQVVDVLKKQRLHIAPADLYHLSSIITEAEPDLRLWHELMNGKFSWGEALKILGWDPGVARCATCSGTRGLAFSVSGQEFFCGSCSSKLPQDEVIYI